MEHNDTINEMDKDKKIKKLLHMLKHTEEHILELVDYLEDNNIPSKGYRDIYWKLKEENKKLEEYLKGESN